MPLCIYRPGDKRHAELEWRLQVTSLFWFLFISHVYTVIAADDRSLNSDYLHVFWCRLVSNYLIHADGKSAGQQIWGRWPINHLSVARFRRPPLTGCDSAAVYAHFRMWKMKTHLQPPEFFFCFVFFITISSEGVPAHANTQHVQFPITLWCQNESTTLSRGGESASSPRRSPRPLWLPLLNWLRLSDLIDLLKKTCFLALETSRYVGRLGVVIFGRRLTKPGSLRCNQGAAPEPSGDRVSDRRRCFCFSQIRTGMDHVRKNDCNYLISQT